MGKVVLITGGSSGIGKNAALALVKAGCTVYEMSRKDSVGLEGVRHIRGDVTDETQAAAAVREVVEREGRLDVLINNAGFGISGAVEFTPPSEAMNKAALPVMREQGGGRIVCMSSVAAPIAIPFQAYYSASKAAVRTYCLALHEEVRPYGVEICVIMPGDIATGFTAARAKSAEGDDVYGGRISRSVAVMEHDEQTGMTAEFAGRFVAKIATKKGHKPVVTMGGKYKVFVFFTRLMSTRLMTFLVGKIYAS